MTIYNQLMRKFIDLHLHLDGSLTPETIINLARKDSVALPFEDPLKIKELVVAPKDCKSLNEYLTRFDLPLKVLQSLSNIHDAVYSVMKYLKDKGFIYAEIRFAPQLHMQKGLTQKEVISAAVCGLEDAKKDLDMAGNLILCFMRGDGNDDLNFQTLKDSESFMGRGVCAVDLAGAEALFPTIKYKELFAKARDMQIPFTIHAGEAAGHESIMDAVSFGASRIGHGTRAFGNPEAIRILKDNGIAVECCITSNIQTKAALSFEKHPIWNFIDEGLTVTLNSDNMTVSDTDVSLEAEELSKDSRFSEILYNKLLLSSINAAFISPSEKEVLKKLSGN